MGLTMGERRAVTKAAARRYRAEDRAGKKVILDELCQLTSWHAADGSIATTFYPLEPNRGPGRKPGPGLGAVVAHRPVPVLSDTPPPDDRVVDVG